MLIEIRAVIVSIDLSDAVTSSNVQEKFRSQSGEQCQSDASSRRATGARELEQKNVSLSLSMLSSQQLIGRPLPIVRVRFSLAMLVKSTCGHLLGQSKIQGLPLSGSA